MKQSISTPIKIAAFFFLVGGMLNVLSAFTKLSLSVISTDPDSFRYMANQLIQIITILSAVLNILVGWFLMQAKRWAYIVGLILATLSLLMGGLVVAQSGTTQWFGLGVSVALLILLGIGRKDFRSFDRK